MTGIFGGTNSSWGTITGLASGSYGAKGNLNSYSLATMTAEQFATASREEQVAWARAFGADTPGSRITIAGGVKLEVVDVEETYRLATPVKDSNGKQAYDAYGNPKFTYSDATRTVPSVVMLQADAADPEGLIPTAGQREATIPYYNLPGSAQGGSGALNKATAEALFPSIDGINETLPANQRPTGFDLKPSDLSDSADATAFARLFNTWHPAYQVEWVELHRNDSMSDDDRATLKDLNKQIADFKADPKISEKSLELKKAQDLLKVLNDNISFSNGGAINEYREQITKVQTLAAELTTLTNNDAAKLGVLKASAASLQDKSKFITIPPGSSTPVATYLLSATPPATGTSATGKYSITPRVYQVETVSKNDLAVMPTEDQKLLAGLAAFQKRADSLGLSTDMSAATAGIDALRTSVTTFKGTYRTENLPADVVKAFTDQLDLLKARTERMSIFSKQDIDAQVKDIKDRFDRLKTFFDVKPGSFPGTNDYRTQVGLGDKDGNTERQRYIPTNTISFDGNQTINSGYELFAKQEMRIRDLVMARAAVADGDGTLNGKKLDAPTLIYYFQSQYNLEGEAKVTVETEEVKQQNAYLKTIAEMQRLINETLRLFKKTDGSDGEKGLLGKDYNYVASAGLSNTTDSPNGDTQNLLIISMFCNASEYGSQPHPLEILRGITRQKTDITRGKVGNGDGLNFDMSMKSYNQWSQYGTQLSEMVTLVNQESQLKMNNINSMDRERNRNYDLANSALQKMQDVIQSIARVG